MFVTRSDYHKNMGGFGMDCPECGLDMIWQNDWDLSDEVEEDAPNMLTMFCCQNEDCNVASIEINRLVKD